MNSVNRKSNDALVKKVRIRAAAAIQKEQFSKVVQNTFQNTFIEETTQIEAAYTNYDEGFKNVNSLIGWQL